MIRWADRINDSSNKRLMFQVLFFFHKILQNSLQKPCQLFLLFFLKITKMKMKSFECPDSTKKLWKEKYRERHTLGRRFVCPIGPALYCRLFDFNFFLTGLDRNQWCGVGWGFYPRVWYPKLPKITSPFGYPTQKYPYNSETNPTQPIPMDFFG